MRDKSVFGAAIVASFFCVGASSADEVTLSIESWRVDDQQLWQEQIIPVFEAGHPGIRVVFEPTEPARYNGLISTTLRSGRAGDLITCRPFDESLSLFEAGLLSELSHLPALTAFSDTALTAWQTDDGSSTYCVPLASVIHGFIYNADIFAELGLEEPQTEDEFFEVLQAIQADGRYIPLAIGLADQWEAATMGYHNIGPNYWRGEEGRLALIAGEQRLTDPQWVEPFETLSRWEPFLGDDYASRSYSDSQQLFVQGRAAIYPAGSWELAGFNAQAEFEMGAFKPPVKNSGDRCYISDHTDIGIGMNANTENKEAAEQFLTWMVSEEFATIFANQLPGFFPLANIEFELEDPLAQEFISWRESCGTTIRPTYQILSRGTPSLESATWSASVSAINGMIEPDRIAARLQTALSRWYAPHQ